MAFGAGGRLYVAYNGGSGADGGTLSSKYEAVPEPATMDALGVGAMGLLRQRRTA